MLEVVCGGQESKKRPICHSDTLSLAMLFRDLVTVQVIDTTRAKSIALALARV